MIVLYEWMQNYFTKTPEGINLVRSGDVLYLKRTNNEEEIIFANFINGERISGINIHSGEISSFDQSGKLRIAFQKGQENVFGFEEIDELGVLYSNTPCEKSGIEKMMSLRYRTVELLLDHMVKYPPRTPDKIAKLREKFRKKAELEQTLSPPARIYSEKMALLRLDYPLEDLKEIHGMIWRIAR